MLQLDTAGLFAQLAKLASSMRIEDVAATAQAALAQGMAGLAMRIADERGISAIALSGGVAYNDHIASIVRTLCEANGFTLYTNQLIPCGDGGVSLGQVAVAGLRIRLNDRP
jgi:hydrogenase maturation protein HypF